MLAGALNLQTCLEMTCGFGRKKLRIDDKNSNGNTALLMAAANGNVLAFEMLLKNGASSGGRVCVLYSEPGTLSFNLESSTIVQLPPLLPSRCNAQREARRFGRMLLCFDGRVRGLARGRARSAAQVCI